MDLFSEQYISYQLTFLPAQPCKYGFNLNHVATLMCLQFPSFKAIMEHSLNVLSEISAITTYKFRIFDY